MIRTVYLRHFKCFAEQRFDLRDQVILVGNNNCGKTTLLQAITTWYLTTRIWLRKRRPRQNTAVAISRRELLSLPLRKMQLLWTNASTAMKKGEGVNPGSPRILSIVLEGENRDGRAWRWGMNFRYANPETFYAQPLDDADLTILDIFDTTIVYIPALSGITVEEPVYQLPYQQWLIGQGKPGDILRNQLMQVSKYPQKWHSLEQDIADIFGYQLLPPKGEGQPFIVCAYLPGLPRQGDGGGLPELDIANAGSGFLQVLMLLAFFYARPCTTLLLDEPDAHLHGILQQTIYSRIRDVAQKYHSQLIIATHSEVFINNTAPSNILTFFGRPHLLEKQVQRDSTREALKRLSASDLMRAEQKRILYVEDESDFKFLCAWAKVLEHPLNDWFQHRHYYHPLHGRKPGEAREHFFALRAVEADMRGIVLLDRDHYHDAPVKEAKNTLRTLVWPRREIENYLLLPQVIDHFVKQSWGPKTAEFCQKVLRDNMTRTARKNPWGTDPFFKRISASKDILPQIFDPLGISKKDYYRIAESMTADEVHPDVREMLDTIADWLWKEKPD